MFRMLTSGFLLVRYQTAFAAALDWLPSFLF